jgi:putative flippase GtrA
LYWLSLGKDYDYFYKSTIDLPAGFGGGFWDNLAAATGTLCGGVTHFMVSRTWVFNAQEKKWTGQLNRYVLVWIGNLVLNVSGLWLLTRYIGLNYLIAKIITAILVAILYNYQLQKRFVFKH